MTYMGKEPEKKMDICITESLCLNLELIQHYKSTMFQYEIKIKQ